MAHEVLTEARGNVLLITLNRPEALNAINAALASELAAALDRLDTDDGLTVGVLTGAGRGFCAGMDLKEFATKGAPRALQPVLEHGSKKPLIGAIEGFALAGGLELAMICDLLVASAGSRLGVPEVGVGLLAAGGALIRLPQRMPLAVAMEMALTGDPISAEQALQFGLVNRVAERGTALEVALGIAGRIADNAPQSILATKAVMRSAPGRTEEELWEIQRPIAAHVFASEDAIEGATAFAQKRTPRWSGR